MMANQPVHRQVFDTDHSEMVNDLSTVLMGEIIPSELNAFMDPGNDFAVLLALLCAYGKLGVLALDFGQGLFFLAEKAGVLDLFPSRKRREGFQADINAHLLTTCWQALGFALDREAGIPLAGTALVDGERFDLACDGSMIDHLDAAHFGERQPIIMRDAEARLWEGKRVMAVLALETGIAWLLCVLTKTPKERFEGEIDTHSHIL